MCSWILWLPGISASPQASLSTQVTAPGRDRPASSLPPPHGRQHHALHSSGLIHKPQTAHFITTFSDSYFLTVNCDQVPDMYWGSQRKESGPMAETVWPSCAVTQCDSYCERQDPAGTGRGIPTRTRKDRGSCQARDAHIETLARGELRQGAP